ncbi:MAG: UDP-N-acetylglucosamine--N-acetylmuramyl-(pentapeptide) pyrophosphoryl-undecaprenol N-acetylglucosamine transferase [Anaerolineae bacterium]|nr:UDP-N-acetylglucosamine--N-acetylmuramyl-(pentapeptide) pyrophosphoryl-undecaprenol N-acetylglucosamine transferase [Anaerolineae bacterium]
MYPALAAVQSLNRLSPDSQILWVGSQGGMEQALVEQAGLKIELISAVGVRGKNPLAAAKSLLTQSRGYRQSRRIIHRFQPEALFVTGGYVCVPVTLAAWRAGVPVLIYLPDMEPGLAIKFLARFASKVAVTTPLSQQFFKPGQSVVTGYPVRAELLTGPDQPAARRQLGLSDDLPVLLVFGGSRGARSINQAVANAIEPFLAVAQVLHITGGLDADRVQARRAELNPAQQARYHVFEYLHEEMPVALQAADLVVSRAGASVLGEFTAIGLPAILAPYPYAGTHQALNANYLAENGAAVVIADVDLSEKLPAAVIDLLANRQQLAAMGQASRALAKPNAADHLAQEILEVRTRGKS